MRQFLLPFHILLIYLNCSTEIGEIEHGVVVHGCGLDEVSPLGVLRVSETVREA